MTSFRYFEEWLVGQEEWWTKQGNETYDPVSSRFYGMAEAYSNCLREFRLFKDMVVGNPDYKSNNVKIGHITQEELDYLEKYGYDIYD